jgi:ribonuclease VapC
LNKVVLDASAVLARLYNEPGGEQIDALLDDLEIGNGVQISISSLNWCEILTRLHRASVTNPEEMLASLLAGVELVPFGKAEAEVAAKISKINPALSLGDRACLALARTLDATAWTTDKIWAQIPFGAKVNMLR